MRKILVMIFTIIMLIGLVACSNESTEITRGNLLEDDHPEVESNTNEVKVEYNTGNALDNHEEGLYDTDDTTDEEAVSNIDIIDFEESIVIEREIDIIDLDVKIETDNRNKRVILFLDQDDPIYKTIYIKHDNRLKIIDIYEDRGQIFNEIISYEM